MRSVIFMELSERIWSLREETGLNRKQFAEHFGIQLRTEEEWETGRRSHLNIFHG